LWKYWLIRMLKPSGGLLMKVPSTPRPSFRRKPESSACKRRKPPNNDSRKSITLDSGVRRNDGNVNGLHLVMLAAVLSAAIPLQAQEFPKRTNLDLTVLFGAGSSADVTARVLAQGMTRELGANVIVVNRPGAGGAIGYKYVAGRNADGYAMVWNSNSVSTAYHSGQMNIDYKAFEPVARVLIETPLIAVRGNARWKTFKELIAEMKAQPGKITVGNSGVGSHTHITSAALFKAAGADVNDIPYAAGQVVPALIGGHVDVLVLLPGAIAGQLKAGTVRVLTAVSAQRDALLPDVPTAQELGHKVALDAWRGVAVPKGTPRSVIATLENAIRQTVQSAEFASSAEKLYVKPAFMPAAEFGALIAREDADLAVLMQGIGLKK
jgi:tripartite-type tricarboxylate transporter receptor subunit TctC